jgi:hypothetical protein
LLKFEVQSCDLGGEKTIQEKKGIITKAGAGSTKSEVDQIANENTTRL